MTATTIGNRTIKAIDDNALCALMGPNDSICGDTVTVIVANTQPFTPSVGNLWGAPGVMVS